MHIGELPQPVTAAKADWLPAYNWLGFTPTGTGPDAKAKCEATVQRQINGGYVLERVTLKFDDPNPGFENDPRVIRDRALHREFADGLVAVHRLRHSSAPLQRIVGEDDFSWLQDVWAKGSRNRWSVAFPIVESYEIVGRPKSRDVFPGEVHKRLFQSQSALLRPIDDEARRYIDRLEIRRLPVANAEFLIEDEIRSAEGSQLDPALIKAFEKDLAGCWEGETEERRVKLRRRAVWLARNFAKQREQTDTLTCDHCGFDAAAVESMLGVRKRSCFDVHHLTPMKDGRRFSETSDFALLCPTCHRIEHLKMRALRPVR